MPSSLPIANCVEVGLMAGFASYDYLKDTVGLLDTVGFDNLWVGDHIAFTSPIFEPLLQLAQAAALSPRLKVGTAVYLLSLRSAANAAKQAASVEHLSDGRFVFGVGVGGEFPTEFEACGVPVGKCGARLAEGVDVTRMLCRGEPCSYAGEFTSFNDVHMQPGTLSAGGPSIWCGGRLKAALPRIGRVVDGWISYVVTPAQYAEGLSVIAKGAADVGRKLKALGTAHRQFVCMGDSAEPSFDDASAILGKRYAMDFRRATKRYCALGTPDEVLAHLRAFHAAGVRTFILDFLGSAQEQAM